MKSCLTIVSLMAVMLVAGESRGQAGFAASELNRLSSVSNPAAYSADRIRANVINSALPRSGLGNFGGGSVSNVLGRSNKPFASISRGPSVTPYLALDNPFTSTATSYYTQIRPQIEQQRVNQ